MLQVVSEPSRPGDLFHCNWTYLNPVIVERQLRAVVKRNCIKILGDV
jgi:hypothetical protein